MLGRRICGGLTRLRQGYGGPPPLQRGRKPAGYVCLRKFAAGHVSVQRFAAFYVWVAMFAIASCTSGPGPPDDRPYLEQVLAFRAEKDQAFRTGKDSPIPAEQRAAFPGLAYYPVDPEARVPTYLTEDRAAPAVVIELQTSGDERRKMRKVGTLGFAYGGASYRLTAFADVGARNVDRLFVPFGDLTNVSETYRGGRYLDLDRTPTGLYDLDFNHAYHPFCVYNPTYICPVPPAENRLPVAIQAGERFAK